MITLLMLSIGVLRVKLRTFVEIGIKTMTVSWRMYFLILQVNQNQLMVQMSENSFIPVMSNKPSYFTRSQAKIQDVDFVTYIFGALGTWLGLSFWSINPIPFLFSAVDQSEVIDNNLTPSNHSLQQFKRNLIVSQSIQESRHK